MRIALEEAGAALADGDFPVGCVLVEDGRVIARGRRINSSGEETNEVDHAEVDTLRDLLHREPGRDLSTVTAYTTMEPCLMCYATLLLSGIRTFVWGYEDVMGGGTSLPLERLSPLYANMRVELIPGVLRGECLALFTNFFRQYSYWADSELARYTLEQAEGEQ
ncbi:MAG: tRNA adenosine(34) deaminase TadA [Desulfobulbaceae bacterium]